MNYWVSEVQPSSSWTHAFDPQLKAFANLSLNSRLLRFRHPVNQSQDFRHLQVARYPLSGLLGQKCQKLRAAASLTRSTHYERRFLSLYCSPPSSEWMVWLC